MKSSLSTIIITRLLSVVMLTVIFVGAMVYFQTKENKLMLLEQSLLQISNRLAKSLEVPIWNLDTEDVARIVELEMDDQNIVNILVTDDMINENGVFRGRDEGWNIIRVSEDPKVLSKYIRNVEIVRDGIRLGDVTVILTDNFVHEQLIDELIQLGMKMLLVTVLAMVALILSLKKVVSKPILELSNSCRQLAEGDFKVELEAEREDEIGSLARSFSRMRDAIQEKIQILNMEIKERKRSEDELRRLRLYFANIVDSMPSILIGLEDDLQVTLWNVEAEKATQIKREDAIAHKLDEILPAMSRIYEKAANAVSTAMAEPQDRVRRVSKVKSTLGTEQRIYDVAIYPIEFKGSSSHVLRLDDITEKEKLEEVIVHTEKMLSVGGLAAGMAHEINNPLAGILQSTQVIANRLSPEMERNRKIAGECGIDMDNLDCYLQTRDIHSMLRLILDSGERASRILNNMLSFSVKSESRFSACDIRGLLDKTVELAASEYGLKKADFDKIEIVREYDPSLKSIRCDEGAIQQVFLNVIKNAAQSFSKTRFLEQQDDGLSHPQIALRVYEAKGFLHVEIEDNGEGMSEETRKRVFEPFFTTRDIGQGTGLGLSVSFFIIKEKHKGMFQVSSEPGIGSTFTVSLPLD